MTFDENGKACRNDGKRDLVGYPRAGMTGPGVFKGVGIPHIALFVGIAIMKPKKAMTLNGTARLLNKKPTHHNDIFIGKTVCHCHDVDNGDTSPDGTVAIPFGGMGAFDGTVTDSDDYSRAV